MPDSALIASIDFSRRALPIMEGNTSMVYRLFNDNGQPTAIFKPYDEINDGTHAISTNDAMTWNSKINALNEVSAYEFDQRSSVPAGIPETQHAEIPVSLFCDDNHDNATMDPTMEDNHSMDFICGSLQQFVPNAESCEDYGPNLFSTTNVHRIGILDLRILNCDRHTGNLLFDLSEKRLIPIDHALSFPAIDFDAKNNGNTGENDYFDYFAKDFNNLKLADISFDWLMFPQAKQPFSEEIIEEVKTLDIATDLEIMEKFDMSVHQRLAVFSTTTLLKKGIVEYGKTLHDLGAVVQRSGDRRRLSVLELLVLEIIRGCDRCKIETGDEEEIEMFCEKFAAVNF